MVTDAGETVVRAQADVVCRGARDETPGAAAIAEALDDLDIGQIPV